MWSLSSVLHHHIALATAALTFTSYCVFQNSLIIWISLSYFRCDQDHIAHPTNMALWCSHRMFLLLTLVVDMLAYNDTDLCQVCQAPLKQNPRIPWKHLLKNSTYYFSGLKFRHMIRVLPSNSFVSGPYVQVCMFKWAHVWANWVFSRVV